MMWMDHAVDVCVCVVCVRDIKSGICMVHVILLKGAKGGFGGYRWTSQGPAFLLSNPNISSLSI